MKSNQQRRSLDFVLPRGRPTRASQRTRRSSFVGEPRETRRMRFTRGGLSFPSPPSISCINNDMSQTTAVFVLDKYEFVVVACVVCSSNGQWQSRLRGEWQGSRISSRHHHYPIPSARGEAGGMCQLIAGRSSRSTSTPMIRVACSADKSMFLMRVSCVYYYYYYYYTAVLLLCFRLVTTLVASHDMCKTKSGCHFRMGISS